MIHMENKPFWEETYADNTVSTFTAKPTKDIQDFYKIFPINSLILDVGCGEGRNSIFMANLGNTVDAFDISQNGINKAKEISKGLGVDVNFFCCDLGDYIFEKKYDIILSHGVLHCKLIQKSVATMQSLFSQAELLQHLIMRHSPIVFLMWVNYPQNIAIGK